MLQYVFRRTLSLVPVLLGVSIVVFFFVHLIPGDPAVVMLGEHATDEAIARVRAAYGLDRPLWEQYLLFLGRLGCHLPDPGAPGADGKISGRQYVLDLELGEARIGCVDLGRSIRNNELIASELRHRFPATVELTLAAMLIATAVAVPAGILSAIRRNSLLDYGSMLGSLIGVSMPIFWLGLMVLWLFAAQLRWLPIGQRLDVNVQLQPITGIYLLDALLRASPTAFWSALRHLILPAAVLSTVPMAIVARMTRGAMLEVMGQEYIRTAHAKGLRERAVVLRHALKNALLPVVTVLGLQVGLLLSGAVLTETIFSWPGIGKWIFESIVARDYPIVQAVTLVIATVFVVVNLLVDISYALLDPRIRYQ